MNAVVISGEHLPQTAEVASILAVISRAASDPSVDMEKLERLLNMHERIIGKQAEAAFNAAMCAAQAKVGRVAADATNPQTHSRYASYAALDRVLRPVYSEHGFSLSFDTADSPLAEHLRVICHASHNGGHTRSYHVDMPADGKGAKGGDVMTKTHAAGSAMSYGMRYLLKMIFNVAIGDADDDGNAAGGQQKPSPKAPDDYEDWKADMTALADEGLQPLQAGWGRSAPDLRQYASLVDKGWWEATKARARAVPA